MARAFIGCRCNEATRGVDLHGTFIAIIIASLHIRLNEVVHILDVPGIYWTGAR